MASTNKTTNYELSQFEGTDKPSWEADYNADMLIIDTNLKAVSDVADGASGGISTLADRVTTAEGNITTNANDIDALEARADALEAGESTADGRLDALESEQIIQNTAIEGNTQLAYNIARPYDSASTYDIGYYVLFQNTLYKCTTAVTTGEAFDPEKWEAIKVMDEMLPLNTYSLDASMFTLDATSKYEYRGIGDAISATSATNLTINNVFGTYIKYGRLRILCGRVRISHDVLSFNDSYNTNYLIKLKCSSAIDNAKGIPPYMVETNGKTVMFENVADSTPLVTLKRENIINYRSSSASIGQTSFDVSFNIIYIAD